MRIAVAQLTSIPGDVEANVAAHAELIGQAAAQAAAVVVFPELSLTGYELAAIERDPRTTLAPADPRLQPLIDACRDDDLIAVVGAPVDQDWARLLAAIVLDGDGVREIYGKQHVHSTESHLFTPGDRQVILEVGGYRLALAVCADSGQPDHAAACEAAGADAYLVGAFHIDDEDQVAAERMAARARDCGLWVALAEHAGNTGTGSGEACGGSGFWAPGGELVSRLGRETPAIAVAEIVRIANQVPGT